MTSTIEAPVNGEDLATKFETEVCGRCCGSGHYSYCQSYGTTCFQCHGKGVVYTKRGQAALEYLRKIRTVKVSEVEAGWIILQSAGPINKGGWRTVKSIGQRDDGSKYMEDGAWKPYVYIETIDLSMGTFPDSEVTAVPTKERIAETKALALQYQTTLTKTGTVRKR